MFLAFPKQILQSLFYILNVSNQNTVVRPSCRSAENIRVYAGNTGQNWRENLGIKFFWNLRVSAVAVVVFVLGEFS